MKKPETQPGGSLEPVGSESPRGFISAPTLEQLRPTREEQEELRRLWEWQEASKRDLTMWDTPIAPNAKLTDDEERAKDTPTGTCG